MSPQPHSRQSGKTTRLLVRQKRAVIGGLIALCVLFLVAGLGWLLSRHLGNLVRVRAIAFLEERLQSDVEIGSLSFSVFPRIAVSAEQIVLHHHRRTDVPPLITLQQVTADATILGMLRTPKRVTRVQIQGLTIQTPPKRGAQLEPEKQSEPGKPIPDVVVIDEIIATDTLLRTLPRDPQKTPREFRIHDVTLSDFSFERPASFRATLTNPKPLGEIASQGEFGPWNGEDPGDTPVNGTFRFSDADFSTLRGITGILSSEGKYSGVLNRLDVEGDTQTPDFALSAVGNPIPLTTHYVAVVDGTDGDTYLTRVDARLGESLFVVHGQVIGRQGIPGRHITLQAVAEDARIEDLLRLTAKGPQVPMTGRADFRAAIDIPPRPGSSILDRLVVDGEFGVGEGYMTVPKIQDKMDALSRSGQGQPENESIQDVVTQLAGRFILQEGTITFSRLTFRVPGTTVRLAGRFDLQTEQIDFRGHLLMDAKLSQSMTGAKSFFLRLADPFFDNDGSGSSVPIKITGDRRKPEFGLSLLGND